MAAGDRKNAGIKTTLPDLIAVQAEELEMDRPRRGGARTTVDILSVYLEGGPKYKINNRMYAFEPPIGLLVPAGSLDEDRQDGKIRGLCTLFNGYGLVRAQDRASQVKVTLGRETTTAPVLKELSGSEASYLFDLLKRLRSVDGVGLVSQMHRTSLLYEALAWYCQCPGRAQGMAVHREAVRLRELIRNFAFEITPLKKLYEETDLSTAYAETLFRKAFGITPVEYRMQLRIRRARELLASSRLNVSQVAMKVGFTDPLYFSRVFRKTEGVTPSSLITGFKVSREKAL